jgi:phage major head subunit gpT-like protein
MTMLTSNFSSLMLEGLKEVSVDQYKQNTLVYPKIYKIENSKKQTESYQDIVGTPMWTQKDEGTSISYADMLEGYAKSFTHTAWAKGIRVSRELRDDELYGVMNQKARLLGQGAAYRKEYEHAKLFNNASAATYFTGQDGLALLSDSHTQAGVPGGTLDNYVSSTDLSLSALDTAFALIRRFTDENGELAMFEPATLLIPPELDRTAVQLLQSAGLPGSADNDTNYYKGRLNIVTWPFITDTNAWFILVSKSQLAPISFNRVPVEFKTDGDFDTDDAKIKGYMRFSNGFVNPRFCVGSMGSS